MYNSVTSAAHLIFGVNAIVQGFATLAMNTLNQMPTSNVSVAVLNCDCSEVLMHQCCLVGLKMHVLKLGGKDHKCGCILRLKLFTLDMRFLIFSGYSREQFYSEFLIHQDIHTLVDV